MDDPIREKVAELEAIKLNQATQSPIVGKCRYCKRNVTRDLAMNSSLGLTCPDCFDEE